MTADNSRSIKPSVFLKTPGARSIYQDILKRMLDRVHTKWARGEIRAIVPVPNGEGPDRSAEVMKWKDTVSRLGKESREKMSSSFSSLDRWGEPTGRPGEDWAVLVQDDRTHQDLLSSPHGRMLNILTRRDRDSLGDYSVVVALAGDLDGDNIVPVRSGADLHEFAPQVVVSFFSHNRNVIEAVGDLIQTIDVPEKKPSARLALEVLDGLVDRDDHHEPIAPACRDVLGEMNSRLREGASNLSVSGSELLDIMEKRSTSRIDSLVRDTMDWGMEQVKERTGKRVSVFRVGFPIEMDEEELERVERGIRAGREIARFTELVMAAGKLAELREGVERELEQCRELDLWCGLGQFALEHDLNPAREGRDISLEGGLHLSLPRDGSAQMVDFSFGRSGDEQPVVLLTGANSGGKTTLLELVAQTVVLHHMGLPVPARDAKVPPLSQLHLLKRQKSMNAGTLEHFLKSMARVLSSQDRKLILADEMEAITELDAAARIIGTYIEIIEETGSYGIFVTHLAPQILQHAQCRVDGIEARGLDDRYNLLVDRTPRRGLVARSTPELIVTKLASISPKRDRDVYLRILDRFGK